MRALITGFPGQDACYLAELLLDKGYEVYGMIKRYTSPNYSNIDYLNLREKGLKLLTGDVTDIGSIYDCLEDSKPDEVYNLAAQSYVGSSWRLAHVTSHVDAIGPLNFLEVIKRTNPKIKFYQAGTSEMFGNNSTNGVQTEKTAFMPASPYGVAKLYGFHITRNFRESYDMFISSGILFNHESPRRGIEFVTQKIATAFKNKEKVSLGNINAKRDWGHAKDYVKAMWLMLQQEKPDDYVISTDIQYSVRDFAELAAKFYGFEILWKGEGLNEVGVDKTSGKTLIKVNPNYFRPTEVDTLLGDSTKARQLLKWRPEITFEKLVEEMCD